MSQNIADSLYEEERIIKIANSEVENLTYLNSQIMNLLNQRKALCQYYIETQIEANRQTAKIHLEYLDTQLKLILNIL